MRMYEYLNKISSSSLFTSCRKYKRPRLIQILVYTVLPPNSRFLGLGIFREFEIRELKIHDFPPNSLYNN